jgi:hypothetical protein
MPPSHPRELHIVPTESNIHPFSSRHQVPKEYVPLSHFGGYSIGGGHLVHCLACSFSGFGLTLSQVVIMSFISMSSSSRRTAAAALAARWQRPVRQRWGIVPSCLLILYSCAATSSSSLTSLSRRPYNFQVSFVTLDRINMR